MANIDNIDRDALREAYSRYAHNEIDYATRKWRMGGQAMNLSGYFSRGDKVLELDPLVKYRFVGRQAIDDLDFSGAIQGNPDRTWGGSPYHTPFFTQGTPYWGIGEMAMRGTGTSEGMGSSTPYLIGTYGNDWISSATGENLELEPRDINPLAVKRISSERGITPENILSLGGFQDRVKSIQSKINKVLQDIEKRDLEKRRNISSSGGEVKAEDYLERSVQIGELDSLMKEHREVTREFSKFAPQLSAHLFGDADKGIPSWASAFGETSTNLHIQDMARYLKGTESVENLAPSKITEFRKPFGERTKRTKRDLIRYPELAKVPLWGDYSSDLQKLLKLQVSVSDLSHRLGVVSTTTNLTPTEFSLSKNPDDSFSVNPMIKTGLKSRDPFYLDVSSDEGLYEKIKNGTASPSEISRAFGIGALQDTGFRGSIGDERLDYMAFPNDNIETMPSVVIPRVGNKGDSYGIPASAVQLANRPFAVWEWKDGKFKLINEGNNPSIGGSKPIPTGSIEKAGGYGDLTNQRVSDFFKRFQKGGRKGFAIIPEFLQRAVGEAALINEERGGNMLRAVDQYRSNPAFRANANAYIGQTANNAVKGAGVLAYASGLMHDAPSTIVSAGIPFTKFMGVGPVLDLGRGSDLESRGMWAYGGEEPQFIMPERPTRTLSDAYLDYINDPFNP